MKNRPDLAVLVALTAMVAGCSDPADTQLTQRDVYTGPNAVEDCVADWGNEDLCKAKISEEEEKKLAAHNQSHSSGGSNVFIFHGGGGVYGPAYSGERTTSVNGQSYTPASSRATNTASFQGLNRTPTHYSAPLRSSPNVVNRAPSVSTTSTTTRGGFGATGSSVSTSTGAGS